MLTVRKVNGQYEFIMEYGKEVAKIESNSPYDGCEWLGNKIINHEIPKHIGFPYYILQPDTYNKNSLIKSLDESISKGYTIEIDSDDCAEYSNKSMNSIYRKIKPGKNFYSITVKFNDFGNLARYHFCRPEDKPRTIIYAIEVDMWIDEHFKVHVFNSDVNSAINSFGYQTSKYLLDKLAENNWKNWEEIRQQ